MAVQSIADTISEMRDRVGDNIVDNYFFTDAQWTSIIKTAERKLPNYVTVEDEEVIDGTGAQEYTIPATALNVNWTQVFHRWGDDHTTDSKMKEYDTNAGTIYLPVPIGTGESVVIWYSRPFIVGTDELTDDQLEILYILAEIEYITLAAVRRADFTQWASLNRSDTSINQMMILKQDLKRDLADLGKTLGQGTDVSDFARW